MSSHASGSMVDSLGWVFSRQRERLVEPIYDYLSRRIDDANPSRLSSPCLGQLPVSSSLVLDGTGPRLTIQLPYLSAMGLETISRFDRVFAFSGGIGAYCAYLAQVHGCLNHDLSHYLTSIDQEARQAHRLPFTAMMKLLNKFISKQPVYSHLCYMDLFRHVISKEFLSLPIDELAPNFIPYVAMPKILRPLAVTAENGFDRASITVAELMAAGMKIPHIYDGGSCVRRSSLAMAYDAAYTAGYLPVRSRLLNSHDATVILTTLMDGLPEHVCAINLFEGKKADYQRAIDIISLLFNIPSKRYQRDLELAYL